jgi:hypothetical protein
MAEPGKAPTAGASLQVAITYNSSNGKWNAVPPDGPSGAAVNNRGQVTFHGVPSGGCRVYTSPAGTFVNETKGYEQLSQGNNTYTLAPGVDDTKVSYCVCDPSATCDPTRPIETGGYSIQVGNPGEGGKKK